MQSADPVYEAGRGKLRREKFREKMTELLKRNDGADARGSLSKFVCRPRPAWRGTGIRDSLIDGDGMRELQ